MQVHNIQLSNCNNSYSASTFKALNVTDAGYKMIKSWHGGGADVLRKIDLWKEQLANTKNFDLIIGAICNDLFMEIERKKPNLLNCEAPLRVYDVPTGRKMLAYGTDLIDCGDWVTYPLSFASDEEAIVAYQTLKKYQDDPNIYTINKIAWAVDSVEILEKGVEDSSNNPQEVVLRNHEAPESKAAKSQKLPFFKRLKNAWLALKG